MRSEDETIHDVRRVIATGVVLTGVAVVLQTSLYLVDVHVLGQEHRLLDLDGEGGLAAWAGSVTTFSVGLVVLLLSFVDPSQTLRGPALALATTFISFDDAVELHETIGADITHALGVADSYLRIAWPAVYLPFLAIVALLLLQLARTSCARIGRLLVTGLILLMTSVAFEIAVVALDETSLGTHSWLYTAEIVLEENAELVGWMLITTAIAARLIAAIQSSGNARVESPARQRS